MSRYGGRYMDNSNDLLFRVKITYPAKTPEQRDNVLIRGPYESVRPARSMLTRLKNQSSRNDVIFELEACLPEWKVFD